MALLVGQTDCLTLSTATQLYFLTRQPPSTLAGNTRLQVTLPLAQADSPRQQAVCLSLSIQTSLAKGRAGCPLAPGREPT